MGCLCAFVFGILGGTLAVLFFGGPAHGGRFDQIADVYTFILGVFVMLPIGALIGGTIDKMAANKQARSDQPKRQFSRQITGSQCCVCGETILLANDGRRCDQCSEVFHTACAAKHECLPPSAAN